MSETIGRFIKLLPVLIALSGNTLFAQEVIFCNRFTNTGIPKDTFSVLTVDKLPTTVKVLFNNGRRTIDKSKINIVIELEGSRKIASETFPIYVSQSRNWVGSDITFKHDGMHKVSAFTPENKILASAQVEIKTISSDNEQSVIAHAAEVSEAKQEVAAAQNIDGSGRSDSRSKLASLEPEGVEKTPTELVKEFDTGFDPDVEVSLTEDEKESLLYGEARLEFGLTGSSDSEDGNNVLKLDRGRIDVKGTLLNGRPLGTTAIQVDIWQKGKDGSFSELTVSEEHKCDPEKYRSDFPLRFYREGDYKVSVYTKDFVWIVSGNLTISR